MDPIIVKYVEFRTRSEECDPEDSMFCSEEGISIDKLTELKRTNVEWMKEVLQKRRDAYILKLMEVDDGLFRKACLGDVKAIELIYERWDGYVRKKQSGSEVNVNLTLAGMIRNANRGDEQNAAEDANDVKPEPGNRIAGALSEGPSILQ